MASEAGIAYQEAQSLAFLAACYASLDEPDRALDYGNRSLQITRDAGYRMQEGRALTGLAQVYQAQGRLKLAIECAETAVDVYADIGWKIQQARAYRLTGQLLNTPGATPRRYRPGIGRSQRSTRRKRRTKRPSSPPCSTPELTGARSFRKQRTVNAPIVRLLTVGGHFGTVAEVTVGAVIIRGVFVVRLEWPTGVRALLMAMTSARRQRPPRGCRVGPSPPGSRSA